MTDTAGAIVDALRSRGHRVTPQRLAIVEEALRMPGHIAPGDLLARARAREPGVNASTVYRTLALLEELGFVSHAHLEGGPEYRVGDHDHVHLMCRVCGGYDSVAAGDVRPAEDALRRHSGFAPDFTHFAIAGVCARCAQTGEESSKP
ncbi:MAG TPA: Fur family transcriptional regulator [Actinomycetota bacterium]|nr:Fur family transcriptional regulator [Actinomycetota bacterium]